MTINLEKLNNYKQEITFLINRKGKIFYHKIDLFHDHEDLLFENKDEVGEYDVCRLVYDPNSDDASFCGIPGISASMNVRFNNLPFELKSTHLNAIENWVKQYDDIVKYAEEHKDEYSSDNAAQFVRSMNRMYVALYKNDKNKRASWEQVCKTWYKWQQQYPVLKWLDADEECTKLDQSDLVGVFFEPRDQEAINDYLQDCIYRAEERYKRISIEKCSSFIEEKPVEMPGSTETHKSFRIEQKMDLARFIEVSNQIIQDSGEPGALYFTIGGQLLYSVITRIAERACEIKDEEILQLLQKLKMVEPIEGEDSEKTRVL